MAVEYNNARQEYLVLLAAFSNAQADLLEKQSLGYTSNELALKVRYSFVLLTGLDMLISDPNENVDLLNDYFVNITFLLVGYIDPNISFYSFLNNGGGGTSGTVINVTVIPRRFIQLTDVPQSYAGASFKQVNVNADATGLEFVEITDTIIPITSNGQTAFVLSPAPQNYTEYELYLNGMKLINGVHYSLNSTGNLTYSFVSLKTTSKLLGRGY